MGQTYTVICTKGHPFDSNIDPANSPEPLTCPELVAGERCGASVETETRLRATADLNSDGMLAEVTAGAEDWWTAIGGLEATLRFWTIMAVAHHLGEMFRALREQVMAMWVIRGIRAAIPRTDIVVKEGHEELLEVLPLADRAQAADEMVKIQGEMSLLEDRKSTAVAAFKMQRERLEEQMAAVAARIREGRRANVPVAYHFDYRVGTVTVMRTDTGEVLRERPMTGEERQRPLPLGDDAAPSNGKRSKKVRALRKTDQASTEQPHV